VAEEESFGRAASVRATNAAFHKDETPAVESTFARDEAGAFDADQAGEAVDQPPGFDRQREHEADVTDGPLVAGRTVLFRHARLCGRFTGSLHCRFAHFLLRLTEEPVTQERLPHECASKNNGKF
jgi:hypothetical protein